MKVEWTSQAATELDQMLAYIAAEDAVAAGLVAARAEGRGEHSSFPESRPT